VEGLGPRLKEWVNNIPNKPVPTSALMVDGSEALLRDAAKIRAPAVPRNALIWAVRHIPINASFANIE